ncbi:MAG: DUF4390 domain-containing protein [Deltaproteobacteria bacterium]|nr:DUF4390 domain-containing protein [Deltaproteobacteria bacterium]
MVRKTFLFLIIVTLIITSKAFAKDPELSNIIVTNTRDDLLIFLKVDNAFNKKLMDEIKSGLPTSFTYLVNLDRVRSLWMDKNIVELTFKHTIKWDSLKNEYTVIRSWENNKKRKTRSFIEAAKLMTEVDSLKVASLATLEKGELYKIRAKSELRIVRLPLRMDYVLFFVSYWDFETDWHAVEFIY